MIQRHRRLRRTPALRELAAETRVYAEQLIQPHFVLDGPERSEDIPGLDGIQRQGVEAITRQVETDLEYGLRNVLLFGVTDQKDSLGGRGAEQEGPVQRATRALRKRFGSDLVILGDVCLCTYTDHGHCGAIVEGEIANDPSLDLLARQSVSLAEAGVDLVAPSDMMDGRVAAIRTALDAAGHDHTGIMSYAAKFASSFYGPFRGAAGSSPAGSDVPADRKTYQMDYRNGREALRETVTDLEEGADIVMVKPALAYLDVIARVADLSDRPVAAYLVSGEYAALQMMARAGMAEERDLVREHLHAVRRAGADLLITYHARKALQEAWL